MGKGQNWGPGFHTRTLGRGAWSALFSLMCLLWLPIAPWQVPIHIQGTTCWGPLYALSQKQPCSWCDVVAGTAQVLCHLKVQNSACPEP